MGTIKTKEHDQDVYEFIDSYVDKEEKKKVSYALIRMMEEVSGKKAKMWGDTMIGFGKYHYKSTRSTQEGDWFPIGFSPRKTAISIYGYSSTEEEEKLLQELGKFKMGKSCIYVKKMSDIDMDVLKEILKLSLKNTDENWGLID